MDRSSPILRGLDPRARLQDAPGGVTDQAARSERMSRRGNELAL